MPAPSAPRYLPPTLSRRELLPALLHELRIYAEAMRGRPTFELSLLADLPEHELDAIVPVLNAGLELTVDQQQLCCRDRATGRVVQSFPLSQEDMLTLALFDGSHTLGEVGRQVAAEAGLDVESGLAQVRALFLALTTDLVCVPANPPAKG